MYSSATNAKNDIRDATSEAKDNLVAMSNRAGHKVRNFIDSASDEFTHASKTVTEHVHDKPMQSSLMALGIGFVLGILLRR